MNLWHLTCISFKSLSCIFCKGSTKFCLTSMSRASLTSPSSRMASPTSIRARPETQEYNTGFICYKVQDCSTVSSQCRRKWTDRSHINSETCENQLWIDSFPIYLCTKSNFNGIPRLERTMVYTPIHLGGPLKTRRCLKGSSQRLP